MNEPEPQQEVAADALPTETKKEDEDTEEENHDEDGK
jgi:hypothetical protein